jgi:hypothetical protein
MNPIKSLLRELEIYDNEEQLEALTQQIEEIEYNRRKEDIIRDYENADREAYFMIVTLGAFRTEEVHDKETCEGSFYPSYEDYNVPPVLVCLLCVRRIQV